MAGAIRELKHSKKEEVFFNRVPPQNIEAEQSILGGILIDNTNIYQVIEIIDSSDFYRESHAKIYKAILDLYSKSEPADLITLSDILQKKGQLDEVGGPAYLSQLVDSVPAASNIVNYARIIKEKSVLRKIVNVSLEIATTALEDVKDVDNFIDKAEKQIFEITENRVKRGYYELKEVTSQVLIEIMKRIKDKHHITGVSTGYKNLDLSMSGFQPANLIIIASRPSVGKTALGTNIALNAALQQEVPVGFFTIEMSKEEVVKRMLCSHAKIDSQRLRSGYLTDKEAERLLTAAKEIEKAPIYIDDTSTISVLELRAKARRLKAEHDVGIIFVDYLQLVQGPRDVDTREQEISYISRSLKSLSKELNIPVVAMAQLSRQAEMKQNERPKLAHLRESGAIEQDADLILFLYREDFYNPKSQSKITEVIIGKNRNGPTDVVNLVFLKEYTRFEDSSNINP